MDHMSPPEAASRCVAGEIVRRHLDLSIRRGIGKRILTRGKGAKMCDWL
jgi:hypothetical protein